MERRDEEAQSENLLRGTGETQDKEKPPPPQNGIELQDIKENKNNGLYDRKASDPSAEPLKADNAPEEEEDTSGAPIDRGYAWVVLACSLIIQAIGIGLCLSGGVFIVEWKETFDVSISGVSLVGSLCAATTCIAAPIPSIMCKKMSHRMVIVIGSIISCIGLIFGAFASSVYMLYIGFGILTGFGISCIYNPCVVMVGFYFKKRRPLAMGLASVGGGVGPVAMAPLARYLITVYGWRGAMVICAGILLNSAVFGLLLFPIESWSKKKRDGPKENKSLVSDMVNVELLKDYKLWGMFFNLMLWGVGNFVFFMLIVDYCVTKGLSKDFGAMIVSLAALLNAIGKITVSLIMTALPRVKPIYIYSFCCTMLGVSLLLFPTWEEYTGFIVITIIYGSWYGGVMGSFAISVVNTFGVENSTSAFCYTVVGDGIGALIGPPIAGKIFEASNYRLSFVFGGSCGVASGILLGIVNVIECARRRKAKAKNGTSSNQAEDVEIK